VKLYLINYTQFLVLVQHFAYKEYIQLFKMSTVAEGCVPILTPMALFGTSSFCWRFSILAVICLEFHHLADIYVVLLQHLLHFLHCIFVRMWGAVRHINMYCKQII